MVFYTVGVHSFLIIMLVAAIITPPDLMTLILVTIPLYLLYEISIRVTLWGIINGLASRIEVRA